MPPSKRTVASIPDPELADVLEHVDLDLDSLERPEAEVIRPFSVNIGGRKVTMSDPQEVDWQDLVDVGDNPIRLIKYVCSQEDREHIADQEIPGWKLGRLMEAYLKHYQFEEQLAKAQRQARGLI